jgi:hypothetical protein
MASTSIPRRPTSRWAAASGPVGGGILHGARARSERTYKDWKWAIDDLWVDERHRQQLLEEQAACTRQKAAAACARQEAAAALARQEAARVSDAIARASQDNDDENNDEYDNDDEYDDNDNVDIGLVEKPFQHTCLYHLQDCVVNGVYLAI